MTAAAFALALALVVAGVSLVHVPAGMVVAGVLIAVCAVLAEAGGKAGSQ